MTQSFRLDQRSVYFVHVGTNFAHFNMCKSEKLQETVGGKQANNCLEGKSVSGRSLNQTHQKDVFYMNAAASCPIQTDLRTPLHRYQNEIAQLLIIRNTASLKKSYNFGQAAVCSRCKCGRKDSISSPKTELL